MEPPLLPHSNLLQERITIPVTGITCAALPIFIQRTLAEQAGVQDAAVQSDAAQCDGDV
jgi:hypothetical protein